MEPNGVAVEPGRGLQAQAPHGSRRVRPMSRRCYNRWRQSETKSRLLHYCSCLQVCPTWIRSNGVRKFQDSPKRCVSDTARSQGAHRFECWRLFPKPRGELAGQELFVRLECWRRCHLRVVADFPSLAISPVRGRGVFTAVPPVRRNYCSRCGRR